VIILTTPRLRLRDLRPEDVTPDYVGWLNDPAINRHLETRFTDQHEDSVRDFVVAQRANPDVFLLRIALERNDIHIGNIKLGPINRYHARAQISLLIGDRAYHGQGLATEAISAVSDWGFAAQALARIEGGCYADNLGSLRAFLKSGYTVEGFRRAAVVAADGARQGSFWFARLADDGRSDAGNTGAP
jgi:ribosomal-protein-alanine N-acetyltransferase